MHNLFITEAQATQKSHAIAFKNLEKLLYAASEK